MKNKIKKKLGTRNIIITERLVDAIFGSLCLCYVADKYFSPFIAVTPNYFATKKKMLSIAV